MLYWYSHMAKTKEGCRRCINDRCDRGTITDYRFRKLEEKIKEVIEDAEK